MGTNLWKKVSSVAVTTLALTGMTTTAAISASAQEPTGTPGPYTNSAQHVDPAEGEGARGSIAILPDTQFYSRYGVEGGNLYADQYGPDIPNPFTSQTTWITENADLYNIDMTLHLGDVVDQDRDNQWAVAFNAISVLEEAGSSYSIVPGNHDATNGYLFLWPVGGEGLWDRYLQTFPADRQAQSPSHVESSPSGASSYHQFEVAGVTMANVALADQSDFAWANEIIKENSIVPTIVTMHEILDLSADGSATTPNAGEVMWNEVVSTNPNVFMTFSGHNHGATNQIRYINDDENLPVFQQLIDYQMAFQGGNGLMSLVEFDFTNNQLSQTGFSPWVFDKAEEDLTDLDQAILSGDGDTYTIPFDFEKRFSQFDAIFEPTGDVPSATSNLRTFLTAEFDTPEIPQPRVPEHEQDFYASPNTSAHWRPEVVDGELTYADITGNGNDMTLRNSETSGKVTLVDGEDDSYLYSSAPASVLFEPNSKTEYRYFQTGDDAPINSSEFRNGYTVEAFIAMTPGTPNTSMTILGHPVEGMIDGDVGAKLGITNLNEVQWKSAGADDVEGWSNWSGEIFKNNNWYHLAVVNDVDDATVEVFINGNPILRNRSGAIHNGINTGTGNSGPWIIGGGGNFQDNNSFHGRIGEVRITEGALPQEQWLTGRGQVTAPEPSLTDGKLAVEFTGPVTYSYESANESGDLTSGTPVAVTAETVAVTATAEAGYTLGVDENGERLTTLTWELVNDAYEAPEEPTDPGEPTQPEEPTAPGVGNGFHISNSWSSTTVNAAFSYGRKDDEVFVGDWDGDGKDSFAVRRGNTIYVANELKGGRADHEIRYGKATDELYVGDWDGNGTDTFAVRRGNTYHVLNTMRSGDADHKFNYGRKGDVTHVDDWDGDGADTIAVTRGTTFYVRNSLAGGYADISFNYGRQGDEVFAGDFDGDGSDTLSIRRGNTLYVNNRLAGGAADFTYSFGKASDDLFIGDFDGDNIDTPAVRR